MSGMMQFSVGVMPGCQADNLPCATGSDVKYREDEKLASYPAESPERALTGVNLYLESNESVNRCVCLEKKWILWHEFIKDHSCFTDWLQLAEKSARRPRSAVILYITAKEDLKRYQDLQVEIRSRLAQLDSLNEQHRVLAQHFRGVMAHRLTSMVLDSSRRWDVLSKTVENACHSLKHFVAQREEFESQCDEMAIWLADMDLRLTEVEHFSGKDTYQKMQQLQSFQEAVGGNVVRLNKLLERGEALIQHCEPADAQEIEESLQELLLYCIRVFEGVGRLHTRLLSMRLVFEEDWLLAAVPVMTDSSKALQEDEGIFEKSSISEQFEPNHSDSMDHLVLEWDPSVDIGGSVSHDDADSDYSSAITGLHWDEPVSRDTTRRSYRTSKDSRLDMAEMTAGSSIREAIPGACVLAKAPESEQNSPNVTNTLHNAGEEPLCLATQTSPWIDRCFPEPVTFDPDRISAWLGQTFTHGPNAPARSPCLKGVQTECAAQFLKEKDDHPGISEDKVNIENGFNKPSPGLSRSSPWLLGASHFAWMLKASTLLYVLLALLLGFWASLHQPRLESGCHHSSSLARSFHLMLHYVNGPPPT
ncbi:nesprin-1 isoform X1 [Scleropages formosus]|uniref:nesprin-1 isoform X1 n=1 Tax=Scleropages formosus TaxID=113540 RepID=UPI00087883ED|nr:nesprin-1-like isoform X1 [Scleropages formosus]